jgi:hypothetical protein
MLLRMCLNKFLRSQPNVQGHDLTENKQNRRDLNNL